MFKLYKGLVYYNYDLFTETARETVYFVDPRPPLFPEAKPRATTAVEGPKNTLVVHLIRFFDSVAKIIHLC